MFSDLADLFTMFPAPVVAGIAVAAISSLLGVFVILKRVVFIGIALSEVAACGVAAGLVLGLSPFACACVLTTLVVAALAYPFETERIPRDAVLGVVFVLASAASILLVSRSGFGLNEVRSLLYGDLILASWSDVGVILGVVVPVAAYFLASFRPTLYTFLDRETARASGLRVTLWELGFFLALGLAVSAASKIAGALLVFCYLVVAPSAALLIARRLWAVMLGSAVVAVFATLGGLYLSFSRDLPTNQTVAALACVAFGGAAAWRVIRFVMARARGTAEGSVEGERRCSADTG